MLETTNISTKEIPSHRISFSFILNITLLYIEMRCLLNLVSLLVISSEAFFPRPFVARNVDTILLSRMNEDDQHHPATSSSPLEALKIDRRNWLQQASVTMLAGLSTTVKANAINVSNLPTSSTSTSSSNVAPSTTTYLSPDQAKITDKVFFDVRISRQDGTFYVRDDLPDTPENRVFQGRLVMGLFGEVAPNHVQRFKSYLNPTSDPLDDNPVPNYGRSVFCSLDQATGLLTGGKIPALEMTAVNGSPALRYGGRLLSSTLWVDAPPRITHTARGLLTHRQLDPLPNFGITTRSDTRELDSSYTVFGKILWDESSSEFLDIVVDLPTYSMERPVVSGDSVGGDPSLVEESARAVYAAQRNFFRSTAKAFGDSRLDKIYEGKLLRRVEVTRVGYL